MADHFEEVLNLRVSAIEHRFESEVAPMQQEVNLGFAAMGLGFGRVMDRIERLEQRMDRLEERMGGLETRMDSLDIKLDGVLEIVQDIARRLPPMA